MSLEIENTDTAFDILSSNGDVHSGFLSAIWGMSKRSKSINSFRKDFDNVIITHAKLVAKKSKKRKKGRPTRPTKKSKKKNKSVAEHVVDTADELKVESVAEHVVETVDELKVESIDDPVIEPADETVVDTVDELKVESIADPVIEPADETVVETAPMSPISKSEVHRMESLLTAPISLEFAEGPKLKRRESNDLQPVKDIISISKDLNDTIHNVDHGGKSKHYDPKISGIHNMLVDIGKFGKSDKCWISIMREIFKSDNTPMSAEAICRKTGIELSIIKRTIESNRSKWDKKRSDRAWLTIVEDSDSDEEDDAIVAYKIDDEIWNKKKFQNVCKSSFQ